MDQIEVIRQVESIVYQKFYGEGSGHDWWHIHRVRSTARTLGIQEGANLYLVDLGALLHDIADHKFHGGDEMVGPRLAQEILRDQRQPLPIIDSIVAIVKEISFKGSGVATPMSSIEGRVVQDADRLDALGAIGIARAFAYGGHAARPLYDPNIPPVKHDSFDQYKSAKGTTVNHFYEKLLLLEDRMNTAAGKRLAHERTEFMRQYLDRFMAEWDGKI